MVSLSTVLYGFNAKKAGAELDKTDPTVEQEQATMLWPTIIFSFSWTTQFNIYTSKVFFPRR